MRVVSTVGIPAAAALAVSAGCAPARKEQVGVFVHDFRLQAPAAWLL
jgi:hypothetical protein